MEKKFVIELKERFLLPWSQSAFCSYFFWIVLIFGGFGIGMSVYEELNSSTVNLNNISKSIGATFLGVIAASLVDLNLNINIKNVPSFTINSFGVALFCVILFLVSFNSESWIGLICAIFGFFLALVIWVLANADNEKLNDENYFYNSMRGKGNHGDESWNK